MLDLDAATVLLQWATGGLFFLWITSRHRLVSLGYGWLLRVTFGVMAGGAAFAGLALDAVPLRDGASIAVAVATSVALVVSIVRRRAGTSGGREVEERRRRRIGKDPAEVGAQAGPEFPPAFDLVAPAIGVIGLLAAAVASADEGPVALAIVRTVVGALFLGAVSDAMLLGHWYLVQPGLGRGPIHELNRWFQAIWPIEVAALLWPTGMVSVIDGSIDDGYGGLLGWFWIACAVTTIGLSIVTTLALRERAYSAVMAATGLLYLAILTAFGTDLVARVVLSRG
jgi:hypothetical protein